jgi:hypothetical protein
MGPAGVYDLFPIAIAIGVTVALCTYFYFHYKTRAEYQKTVRTVIEKGQQLTPEFLERLGEGSRLRNPNADLRWGVVTIALGLGIASFGLILGEEEDAIRPMIAIGNIPFLIGLAFIGLWMFSPKE